MGFLLAIPSFLSLFQISISLPAEMKWQFYLKIKVQFYKQYLPKLYFYYVNKYFNNIYFLFFFIFFANLDKPIINENIKIIIVVIISTLISIYCRGPIYLALTYKGSYTVFNYFEITSNLLIAILVPISFYFFDNFNYTFYILLIISILRLIICYFLINDEYLVKFLSFKYLNFKQISKIIKYSLGFNFEQIALLIKGPGLIFLLGMNDNLSLVGFVTTLRTMFLYLPHRAYGVLFNTFFN